MHLAQLRCERFRIVSALDFTPGPGINVIRGNNAQGKTSILEAVLFLATSKSHRTRNEAELVQHGADRLAVSGRVVRKDRDIRLEAAWWQGAKRFKVNGIPQDRVSDILGKVHVVFFSPEDVGLVRGAAAQRRQFLDMELSQLTPAYLAALQQYRTVLRQRNELLRTTPPDMASLDVWDAQLARYGTVLMERRHAFIERLGPMACAAYHRIAQHEPFQAVYRPDVDFARENLAEVLVKARPADLRRGITTRGPHRDDVALEVGGKAARNFASQGQQRTAALAVKLALLELIREDVGEPPILMLDDVLSELDPGRARRLMEAIGPDVQCLFTATGPVVPIDAQAWSWTFYVVENGQLTSE